MCCFVFEYYVVHIWIQKKYFYGCHLYTSYRKNDTVGFFCYLFPYFIGEIYDDNKNILRAFVFKNDIENINFKTIFKKGICKSVVFIDNSNYITPYQNLFFFS